uniref:Inositol 1,4,5-trisphosphate receptor-interacting protein-like n=1 Tax=Erpetoichthys calabaricus TaxID=27687 RepID=A0A8C4T7Y4_ERPCA
MSTLQMLEELYWDKADFRPAELDYYKLLANHVVTTLLKEVQSNARPGDPKISLKPIGTGSSFEGVKVKPELEFDFMVPLKITWEQIIFSDKDPNIPVCCGLIQIEKPRTMLMELLLLFESMWAKNSDFKKKFCINLGRHGRVLSSGKIQQWFQSMCNYIKPTLSAHFLGVTFTFKKTGPAMTLVFKWHGKKMKIDIVLAIQYTQGAYLVPKKSSQTEETAWRLSFSTVEKAFFNSLTPNSCYLKCLKILKYLTENGKKIDTNSKLPSSCSSYYLKTAFVHQVLQIDKRAWQNQHLESRVRGLLRYLVKCMEQRHLPHIFAGNKELEGRSDSWLRGVPRKFFRFKEANLLSEVDQHTLDEIENRLTYILDNFDEVLRLMIKDSMPFPAEVCQKYRLLHSFMKFFSKIEDSKW